jgi:CubicO group peptidase (beta-lactamase class C family)
MSGAPNQYGAEMSSFEHRWAEQLTVYAQKHGMPGASLGVLVDGEIYEAVHGVLNCRTAVEVTPETVFQLGSITKVWTATLAMQLVDEGRLDLDVPITTYLPEFRVADPDVTRSVTARHLLSHTSGVDGDLFIDTGRGEDCLEKYVAECAGLEQIHSLGATMSYCNSGLTVLGRVVEVLRGACWDVVVREHLFEPLGLSTAGTLPEEALLQRAAVGHHTAGRVPRVVPRWGLFRSVGPVGNIHASARDVLAFAQLHLADGVAPDGSRLLSVESTRQMRAAHVEVPDPYTLGSQWGLGWSLMSWAGTDVYGHNGSTIGQSAFLRIVPDAGVALCLLTNGGHTGDGGRTQDFYHDVFTEVLTDIAGIQPPPALRPPPTPPLVDLGRYAGRYARRSFEITLTARSDRLIATMRSGGDMADALGEPRERSVEVIPVAEDVFVVSAGDGQPCTPLVFFRLPDGAEYLHFGARATPKVA